MLEIYVYLCCKILHQISHRSRQGAIQEPLSDESCPVHPTVVPSSSPLEIHWLLNFKKGQQVTANHL